MRYKAELDAELLKTRFVRDEAGYLTLAAALGTRNKAWPVYATGISDSCKVEITKAFRSLFLEIEGRYAHSCMSDELHNEYIGNIADGISGKFSTVLFNGRFRFGVAQKLINLYLKYLWTMAAYPRPPHCPIDGIIRDRAGLSYIWHTSDSAQEYRTAIEQLREIVGSESLAEWELREFARRRS